MFYAERGARGILQHNFWVIKRVETEATTETAKPVFQPEKIEPTAPLILSLSF